MGIEDWSTTPGSNNAASPNGFPEGMAPSGVNNSARQVMADVRSWYEDAEWIKLGENGGSAYSISFVSTTVFKFTSTDRRSLVPVHRRVKAGVGAGTIYGSITDNSLSASDTQVTVAWDSGVLDASMSYISLGILKPPTSNPSIPRNVVGAKFAGFVTNTGTPALAFSAGGVAGVSDVAKGRTQINLSFSMTDSSYGVLAMQDMGSSPIVSERTKSSFTIDTRDMSLSATDVNFSFAVFGTQ
jgi:hypothetical protein